MRLKIVLTLLFLFILSSFFGFELFQHNGISYYFVPTIILLAFVCEYIDSSLGMGYGTTLTPLLVLMGLNIQSIVPAVLFSELCTGLFASFFHHFDGNINFIKDKSSRNTAILLTSLSLVGVFFAVFLSIKISTFLLSIIIGTIIVLVGIVILLTINKQLKYKKKHIVIIGTIAAFNKGLSGGGYGPLVTGGQVVSGINPKSAVAITSFAEAFVCFVGLICYYLLGKFIDWKFAVLLALGAVLSVPCSTLTIKKISEQKLRLIVGVVTCLLGFLMLIKCF